MSPATTSEPSGGLSAKVTPRSPSSAQATLSLGLTCSTGLSPMVTNRPRIIGVSLILTPGASRFTKSTNGARVGAAHIEEKEAWRHARLSLAQFGAHVGVDERERDERGEAEAERQHDGRRQRAGPVDRGKRHAPLDEARAGRAAREVSDADRRQAAARETPRPSRPRPSPRSIVAGWSGRRARPAPLPASAAPAR